MVLFFFFFVVPYQFYGSKSVFDSLDLAGEQFFFFLKKKREGLVYFFLRYITLLEGVVDLFGPDAPMKMLRAVFWPPLSFKYIKKKRAINGKSTVEERGGYTIFFLAHSLAHVRNRSVLQSGLFFLLFLW